jgi:pyridinium-3,5-biscarboxylic acid mononucleotide synthase
MAQSTREAASVKPRAMDQEQLRALLESVRSGEVDLESALKKLEQLPFADLGYARVDHHRALRQGVPEVILGAGKTAEQIVGVARRLQQAGENVLITRLTPELAQAVLSAMPELTHSALGRTASLVQKSVPDRGGPPVAVVTAGTSDIPVAEEALETLRLAGVPTLSVFDVGVAGLHRLLASLETLSQARALIVVAGMEGALPSVIGGLVAAPVIAVPTSIGYGAAFAGVAALFGMLTSCASGVTVVNIDNGFGAAMAVIRLLEAERRKEAR